MRKLIKRRIYDNEKSTIIGESDNGRERTDPHYEYHSLHRAYGGQYFMYGKGGENSIYRIRNGKEGFSGGENIWIIPEFRAIKWLEKHSLIVDRAEKTERKKVK